MASSRQRTLHLIDGGSDDLGVELFSNASFDSIHLFFGSYGKMGKALFNHITKTYLCFLKAFLTLWLDSDPDLLISYLTLVLVYIQLNDYIQKDLKVSCI